MNTQINVKSALAGLGAGILISLLVAAASSSVGTVGRYQLQCAAQNGNGSECFIIDTVNGKVWKASVAPNVRSDPGFFEAKEAEK